MFNTIIMMTVIGLFISVAPEGTKLMEYNSLKVTVRLTHTSLSFPTSQQRGSSQSPWVVVDRDLISLYILFGSQGSFFL